MGFTANAQEKAPVEFTTAGKFKVGQVWKYDNRPGEDGSTLTVLKIEKFSKGDTIVHIRVDGIRFANRRAPGGYSTYLEHLPYSFKTLSGVVRKLVGQKDRLPDFAEGYQEWRHAWDTGSGGYFTADLKGVIDGVAANLQ